MQQTTGIIRKGVGGSYTVEVANALYICKARGIFRKEGLKPLPGDRVLIRIQNQGDHILEEILPRRNCLLRPTIANVDRIFLLASLDEPKPNLLLIDKMTAIAQLKGIETVLVLTKTDLGCPDVILEIYQKAGIPCLALCTLSSDLAGSIPALAALLEGRVSVFTGNSGVGKSTLLNRLEPSLALETNAISNKLGRGRHTTRHVELFPLLGGYVADTPGFSSLELDATQEIQKEDLPYGFLEFLPHLGHCRFSSCTHVRDQGCAILAAVERGEIHPSRHASYATLYEGLKDVQAWQMK